MTFPLLETRSAAPRPALAPALVPGAVTEPLALYVHIPFCVRKCHYCDFASGPAPEAIRAQYVDALVREIHESPWRGRAARTVFFGGGTPSELDTPSLARIAAALKESFRFESPDPWRERVPDPIPGSAFSHPPSEPPPLTEAEWTIECNPGTISLESLTSMREMGFNRISLGVQTFDDRRLQLLGRIHSSDQAAEGVQLARAAGFRRLNLDLIFCLPDQTLFEWQRDVELALELQPEHLSLYNLTIEEETEFGRRHRMGELACPDEDLSADMFEWCMDRLAGLGWTQYEVSNFALPGEECRHNQIYWTQEPYIGFGLGAASYADGMRWTSDRSMQRYLASAGRGLPAARQSEERLTERDACGEAMMLRLRTRDGADAAEMARRYGLDPMELFATTLHELESDGLLVRRGSRAVLTRRGLMVANGVCARFLP